MTTPRSLLVDPQQPLCYHLVSRCVRRAWLCGQHDGRSYSHRKDWIEQRLSRLAQAFSVDVLAFAILSNHFHVVVYFDPKACATWSSLEVAQRWLMASSVPDADHEGALRRLLSEPDRLERYRQRLGSLSAFMQHLKQPIAVRINQEDQVKGHLFEQRFYSGALLDERAVLTAMRYVDLNPFRAKIAQTLNAADHTSIQRRLEAVADTPERMDQYLAPLTFGSRTRDVGIPPSRPHPAMPRITLREYVALLEETMAFSTMLAPTEAQRSKARGWIQAARLLRKQQRAYGHEGALDQWLANRNFRRPARMLPARFDNECH